MKHLKLLQVVVALILLVGAVGCTTVRGTEDDYYNNSSANRIYVDDPYRGTVVLERDPYTGRYYEVNSYGYNNGYNNRYDRRYQTGRIYNNGYGRSNGGYYNRGNRVYRQAPQQPTQEEIRNREKSRDEARKKVLGN